MSALLQILFFCFLFIYNANGGEFFKSESGNSYYLDKAEYTWYNALYECAIRNMRLLTPDTATKQMEIIKIANSYNLHYFWTAGQEVQGYNFIWITNGNNVSYTNWGSNEPSRSGSSTQCIEVYTYEWRCNECKALNQLMCEEDPFKNKKNLELDLLKAVHSAELNKTKSFYKSEMKKYNETIEATVIQELNEYKNKLKSCERLNSSELHSSHNEQKDIFQCQNETDKCLNRLNHSNGQLVLKSQEIEMLTKYHEKEIQLLKEYCDNARNQTIQYKSYKLIFNSQSGGN